jgi:hypothetical protein
MEYKNAHINYIKNKLVHTIDDKLSEVENVLTK